VTDPARSLAESTRHYQGGRWRAAARFGCYAWGAAYVLILAGVASQGPGWLYGAVALVAAAWVGYFELRVIPCGLTLGPDGVVVRTPFRRRRFELAAVTAFAVRSAMIGDRAVFVERAGGSAVLAFGVVFGRIGPFKGSSIRWKDGESDDVVGTLTDHLAALRSATPRPG
jgi:hypothetical protein